MKKIALVADGWKRLITYEWVSGIKKYCREINEKIVICHFNSMGNWNDDPLYNEGEYNIYNLTDFKQFDGIILDVNNMVDKDKLSFVLDKVRNSGVPVISLGHYSDGEYFVSVNNEDGIRKIMEHLYDVHECRNFVFVGGPEKSKENQIRVESYKNCLYRWKMSIEENPVFYGNFEMNCGSEFFIKYAKSKNRFPDAFVCANDNIAAGLISAAQELGYEVPRDFKVTGFDNIDKAYCFSPRISSIPHKRSFMGKECVDIFRKIWAGKEVDKLHLLTAEPIFSESCGCRSCEEIDYRRFVRDTVISGERKRHFEERLIGLENSLCKADSFEDIYKDVGEYFSKMNCDGIILVMDKRLNNLENENVFPIEGYDIDNLQVVYYPGMKDDEPYIGYKEFLDNYKPDGDGVYMFSPFHFRNYSIGFSVLINGDFLYDDPHFYDIQSLVNREILRMYQSLRLKEVNKKLEWLYKVDALTGLYNRRAYFEMVQTTLDDCKINGKKCVIAFFDCDNFKKINDEMGHDKGDEILKKIGAILKESCVGNGNAYRFGGDEFVLINPCQSNEEAKDILDKTRERFKAASISVSIGSALMESDKDLSLQEYVNIADQEMYEQKRAKKGTLVES